MCPMGKCYTVDLVDGENRQRGGRRNSRPKGPCYVGHRSKSGLLRFQGRVHSEEHSFSTPVLDIEIPSLIYFPLVSHPQISSRVKNYANHCIGNLMCWPSALSLEPISQLLSILFFIIINAVLLVTPTFRHLVVETSQS